MNMFLSYAGRPVVERNGEDSESVNPAIAQAIAGIGADSYSHHAIKGKVNAETTRHLLFCLLWLLRHVEEQSLRDWWGELAPLRLHRLLEILFICASCFEYRGKRYIRRCVQQQRSTTGVAGGAAGGGGVGVGGVRATADVKSRLEEMILGQGSARSELIQRRRGNLLHSVGMAGNSGNGNNSNSNSSENGNGSGSGVVGNSQFYTGVTTTPSQGWGSPQLLLARLRPRIHLVSVPTPTQLNHQLT